MMRLWTFDVCELRDRRILKPRKRRKRHKQFLRFEHKPEAMRRDVRHFNVQSACARHRGYHLRVSGSTLQPPESGGHATIILRQFDARFKPKFGLPIGAIYMHVQPRFLAGEEKEPESVFAKNRRAQDLLPTPLKCVRTIRVSSLRYLWSIQRKETGPRPRLTPPR